jgi:hypothetical protein
MTLPGSTAVPQAPASHALLLGDIHIHAVFEAGLVFAGSRAMPFTTPS